MKITIEKALCDMKRNTKAAYFLSQTSASFPLPHIPPLPSAQCFTDTGEALKNATEVGIPTHDQPFSRRIFHSIKP